MNAYGIVVAIFQMNLALLSSRNMIRLSFNAFFWMQQNFSFSLVNETRPQMERHLRTYDQSSLLPMAWWEAGWWGNLSTPYSVTAGPHWIWRRNTACCRATEKLRVVVISATPWDCYTPIIAKLWEIEEWVGNKDLWEVLAKELLSK